MQGCHGLGPRPVPTHPAYAQRGTARSRTLPVRWVAFRTCPGARRTCAPTARAARRSHRLRSSSTPHADHATASTRREHGLRSNLLDTSKSSERGMRRPGRVDRVIPLTPPQPSRRQIAWSELVPSREQMHRTTRREGAGVVGATDRLWGIAPRAGAVRIDALPRDELDDEHRGNQHDTNEVVATDGPGESALVRD